MWCGCTARWWAGSDCLEVSRSLWACRIVLRCIVLCCVVLLCIVFVVLLCIVLCSIVLCSIVLCCIEFYCIVLYCVVLYCIVLYCILSHALKTTANLTGHDILPLHILRYATGNMQWYSTLSTFPSLLAHNSLLGSI